MRVRVLALAAVLALVALAAGAGTAAADAPDCSTVTYDGSGTESDPYDVSTVDQLQCIGSPGTATSLSDNFTLVADIDATGTDSWNGGDGFEPIGSLSSPFTGTLDGAGHTIDGLTVLRETSDQVGLFGAVGGGGVVENLALTDVRIEGTLDFGSAAGYNAGTIRDVAASSSGFDGVGSTFNSQSREFFGGLVGTNTGTIRNGSFAGRVEGNVDNNEGGLVGRNNGTILNSSSNASVYDSNGGDMGGLVGFNEQGGTIRNSTATGEVYGSLRIGGLVGTMYGGDSAVVDSYATADVTKPDDFGGRVGGLVGYLNGGVVNRAYATGQVDASSADEVGGLVGSLFEGTGDVRLKNSYAIGPVSGGTSVGGLVGSTYDFVTEVSDNYWDVEATGQSSSPEGTGLTTQQMTGGRAPGNMTGLDFTSAWATRADTDALGIRRYYPSLRSNAQSPPPLLQVFAGGDGSASNPYQLSDWDELDAVRTYTAQNFTLVADLDSFTAGYSDVTSTIANGGAGFEPIANGSSFTGTFDGQGHAIADLNIDRGNDSGVGLFGRTEGTITDLAVVDAAVVGGSTVGGLAGSAGAGTVDNVTTTGTIDGSGSNVGGLVGSSSATITRSSSGATVSAAGSSGDQFGGLVGFNDGTVRQSYATGSVEGPDEIGGLVGDNDGRIEQTYATGTVQGNGGAVGGLVGLNNYNVDLSNSYAAAVVSNDGSGDTGGLLGRHGSESTTSGGLYWDTELSGQSSSAAGTGLTGDQMLGDPARSNMTAFDFATVWDVRDRDGLISYPYLRNNVQRPRPGLQPEFAGGSGTESDPYRIADWNHLNNTRYVLGSSLVLVDDLDETSEGYSDVAAPTANGGQGFVPIGNDSSSFDGNFDGAGYTVSDLSIDRPNTDDVGLFGVVGGSGTVTNVALSNLSVVANDDVGGLVGTLDGTVTGSSAVGTVEGDDRLGGLVGEADTGAAVRRSSAAVTVTGDDELGGLVGSTEVDVVDSSASGDVSGDDDIGGLVGYTTANVLDSSASGDVTGIDSSTDRVGGLVGDADDSAGRIERSHATGEVDGTDDRIGGLVGETDGDVVDSYALGNVSGSDDYYGGLVGESDGSVLRSYARGDVVGGDNDAGGLVGEIDGDVIDSNATGDLDPDPGNAAADIGGLVGDLGSGALRSSWATGNVTATDVAAGGLVGDNVGGGPVEGSYATGDVTGTDQVGGLVGDSSGRVTDSYATGDVTGDEEVGGLLGRTQIESGDIIHTNATGDVTASGDYAGGLIGEHDAGDVRRAYATGTVSGTGFVGGLIGSSFGGGVADAYATGRVDATDDYVGGLLGEADGAGPVVDVNASGEVLADTATSNRVGGLIGYTDLNVTRANATGNVTGTDRVGGLIGLTFEARLVEDAYATGTVSGTDEVGGLVGLSDSTFVRTTVAESYATGAVTAAGNRSGGLVGYDFGGSVVTAVNATGDVTGSAAVGGLVGLSDGTEVETAYATGDVSGTTDVGGLLGNVTGDATVDRVYATGDAVGADAVGGLVGGKFNGSVANAYAAGPVSGSTAVGGLIGRNGTGGVTAAYWDVDATGQSASAGGTGLSSLELLGDSARSATDLDFVTTWAVVDTPAEVSSPYLRTNTQTPAPGLRATGSNFTVTITDANGSVDAGDRLRVNVTVDNRGTGDDTQTVTFSVNGTVVRSQSVTLASATSTDLAFDYATAPDDSPAVELAITTDNDTATTTTVVNGPPTARNDSYATPEDTTLSVPASGVLANDSDPDEDRLTATKVSDAANGTATVYANGSIEYTPDPNFDGLDSFTYEASDGTLTDTATVTIDVAASNGPPTARNDSYATPEDTTLSVPASGVLANDSDPDEDRLTATKVSDASHGTATVYANGSIEYTPDPEFSGRDSFTYEASDGVASDTATVTVDVAPRQPNFSVRIDGTDAPVAEGDTLDVTVTVTNVGPDDGTQDVTLSPFDGTVVDSRPVTLAPNATATRTLQWATDNGDAGTGAVTVASANDTASTTVSISARPNASLASVDTNGPVLEGADLLVDATVANNGSQELVRTLTLATRGRQIDTETATVPARGTQEVTLVWDVPDDSDGAHPVTVSMRNQSATTSVVVECIDARNASRNAPPEADCDDRRDDGRDDGGDGGSGDERDDGRDDGGDRGDERRGDDGGDRGDERRGDDGGDRGDRRGSGDEDSRDDGESGSDDGSSDESGSGDRSSDESGSDDGSNDESGSGDRSSDESRSGDRSSDESGSGDRSSDDRRRTLAGAGSHLGG